MKVQVRHGMFETNSSSTHAICLYADYNITGLINKWEDAEYKLPYKEHKLFFGNSIDFGWENKHYHTPEEKAAYLWECIVCCDLVDKLKNRIISVLKKYGVTAQFADTEKRNYGSDEHPNLHDVFVEGSGYVDHGDEAAAAVTAICFNDEYLLNYLFNEDCYVATGNDNDGNLKYGKKYSEDNGYHPLATFFKWN